MAADNRSVRYQRRKKMRTHSPKKLTPLIIAIVIVIACLATSVALGIALGKKADQYKSESKYSNTYEPYQSGDKTVKAVDALYYELGTNAKGYIKNGEGYLSFCLRNSSGELSFASKTAIDAGIAQNEAQLSLKDEVEYVHGLGGYTCAYIYSTAFACDDSYLRGIYKAYEIALIHEAAEAGVDDILIVGLDVNADNIAEIEKYVSDAAIAATNAPLGVLASRKIISAGGEDTHLASRLRSVCDYLAVDLRMLDADAIDGDEGGQVEALVDEMEYYVEAYGLRMVLSRENAAIREDLMDLGIQNIQIIAE